MNESDGIVDFKLLVKDMMQTLTRMDNYLERLSSAEKEIAIVHKKVEILEVLCGETEEKSNVYDVSRQQQISNMNEALARIEKLELEVQDLKISSSEKLTAEKSLALTAANTQSAVFDPGKAVSRTKKQIRSQKRATAYRRDNPVTTPDVKDRTLDSLTPATGRLYSALKTVSLKSPDKNASKRRDFDFADTLPTLFNKSAREYTWTQFEKHNKRDDLLAYFRKNVWRYEYGLYHQRVREEFSSTYAPDDWTEIYYKKRYPWHWNYRIGKVLRKFREEHPKRLIYEFEAWLNLVMIPHLLRRDADDEYVGKYEHRCGSNCNSDDECCAESDDSIFDEN